MFFSYIVYIKIEFCQAMIARSMTISIYNIYDEWWIFGAYGAQINNNCIFVYVYTCNIMYLCVYTYYNAEN